MISYDENKRLINLEKHGFDFIGAKSVFENFHITWEDNRAAYGEVRYQTLGLYGNTLVVVMMAHTPRNDCDHIISIRKATKYEQKRYWQACPN